MAEKTVSVTRSELEVMRQDAMARKPEEACGLLVGREEGDRVKVEEVVPMSNLSKSSERFSIDPEEMYVVLQEAEDKGRTVVGSYHSHPSDHLPSCLDAKYMQHTSYVWMIVPEKGEVRAYVFEDGIKEMRMEEAR
ncbi:Mov34/MPN/PAD-1 family protein [Methanocella sp. MCL-LM]|uniref:Mov34/MPN/PAD-1 family protein n=1 Tax=Methanocella sp. MCL-LM TaxID=3412035 RepID=UPI003C73E2FA